MRVHNIPFSSPFLATLAEIRAEQHDQPLIIITNKRSAQEFCTIYYDLYKIDIQKRVFTYSEIADNIDKLFLSPLSKHLISPCISDLELRHLLHNIISATPEAQNFSVEQITRAIFEFYQCQYNKEDLKLGNYNEKIFFNILDQVEKYLEQHQKMLEPQRQALAIRKLYELTSTNVMRPIYAVLPTIEVPHLTDFFKLLSKINNDSCLITQGAHTNLHSKADTLPQYSSLPTLNHISELEYTTVDYKSKTELDYSIQHLFCLPLAPHLITFKNVKIIKCLSTTEEAETVAATIQRRLDANKESSIGIITLDKTLARKLEAKLQQIELMVENTISDTIVNQLDIQFFLLLAEYLTSNQKIHPLLFLELAKHPFCSIYIDFAEITKFEINILRNKSCQDISTLNLAELDEQYPKIKGLLCALEEGEKIFKKAYNLKDLLEAHYSIFEKIATSSPEESDTWLKQLLNLEHLTNKYFSKKDYYQFISYALQKKNTRNKFSSTNYKIKILTPLEARHLRFDLCIFMGLEEGIFPSRFSDHALFSNQFRKKHKYYYSKEDLIYNASFDLATALAQNEVILSYSGKRATRWIDILALQIKHEDIAPTLNNIQPINGKSAQHIIKRSAGNPCIQHRPKSISVSGIELLMNDPYSFYAKYILRLRMLRDINSNEAARAFGTLIHDVLSQAAYLDLSLSYPMYAKQFMDIYYRTLTRTMPHSSISLNRLWEGRFQRIAKWFFYNELHNIESRKEIYTELAVEANILNIKVKAIIDRLDIMQNGKMRIIDYKSGTIPSDLNVFKGLSPQLPTEGLIILHSPQRPNVVGSELEFYYVELHGRHNVGQNHEVRLDIECANDGLLRLLKKYWEEAAPFISSFKNAPIANDYQHLTRRQESSFYGFDGPSEENFSSN